VTPSDQLDLFRLISQFFWLICLVTTLINYQIARRRIGTRIDPSNTEEAIRYMRRFAVIGALPWGLMGARKGPRTGAPVYIWCPCRHTDV
jgi:hypothetical protein